MFVGERRNLFQVNLPLGSVSVKKSWQGIWQGVRTT